MRFLFVGFCLLVTSAFSQVNEAQVWVETGVTGKVMKDMDWGVEVTNRFGNNGIETFFPQATLKYKVAKWFRPSIEYRLIGNRELAGYYLYSHRINLNTEFRYTFSRLSLRSRIRYQFGFRNLVSSSFYEPEFDRALRVKVEGSYDINDFFLTPVLSAELFYDPLYGPYGQQINKLRFYGGFDLDLNAPHGVSVGYLYDARVNIPGPRTRHVLNLSYSYQIGSKSSKDTKN